MSCKPRCSMGCFFWTTSILFFMIFLAYSIFRIITDPSSVKFYVTEASLVQFNLTSDNTLYYNFSVNITVTNPHKNVIVYYRQITAIAWYKDNDFARVSLAPFDQGHRNTTFLQAVFEGQSVIRLKPKQLGRVQGGDKCWDLQ
ncbi:YLS9 protein [Spatholobus suberectus]|nr:YLS9 protein [Spatholobus suberectus]